MNLFALNKKGMDKETREDYEQEIIFIVKRTSPDPPSPYMERNSYIVEIKCEGKNLENSRSFPSNLSIEEARKLWKELKSEGYKQVPRYSKFKLENEKLKPFDFEEAWKKEQEFYKEEDHSDGFDFEYWEMKADEGDGVY